MQFQLYNNEQSLTFQAETADFSQWLAEINKLKSVLENTVDELAESTDAPSVPISAPTPNTEDAKWTSGKADNELMKLLTLEVLKTEAAKKQEIRYISVGSGASNAQQTTATTGAATTAATTAATGRIRASSVSEAAALSIQHSMSLDTSAAVASSSTDRSIASVISPRYHAQATLTATPSSAKKKLRMCMRHTHTHTHTHNVIS
jgi:hypothetical protein